MGDVRGDTFEHGGFTGSGCMEFRCLGDLWIRLLFKLVFWPVCPGRNGLHLPHLLGWVC